MDVRSSAPGTGGKDQYININISLFNAKLFSKLSTRIKLPNFSKFI